MREQTVCELLPDAKRVLRDYYLASSVEEAIAYLSAHPGEAQIIGGGTKVMPLLQRHQAIATRVVDVSRISALKRVRIEDNYLVIGGAVTYAQILKKELIAIHMPVLLDIARLVSGSRLRSEATLAGSIVHARGNSEGAITLIALGAEAEIANLTGTQWMPIRALFVRPGVSRVNSSAEIITAIRIPLLEAHQGAAMARMRPQEGNCYSPLIAAVALGLADGDSLDWLTMAVGAPTHVPRRWSLSELANGHAEMDADIRASIVETVGSHLRNGASGDEDPDPAQINATVLKAYERALRRARTGSQALSDSAP
jgi:CO/xanthine dehydrogenase FAD-binding subunit